MAGTRMVVIWERHHNGFRASNWQTGTYVAFHGLALHERVERPDV